MKIQSLLFCMVLSFATGAFAGNPKPPTPFLTVPRHTFAPPGFDDNDNAQIVLAGELPDTCYQIGPVSAAVDVKTHEIRVRSTAYFYHDRICMEVIVPYVQTIDLGTLPAGNYTVKFLDAKGKVVPTERFSVAKSSGTSADESMYAPVTDLVAQVTGQSGGGRILVSGMFRLDCMYLKDVKTIYRKRNIIEVLPLVGIRDAVGGKLCLPSKIPFSTEIALRSPWKDHTLVHVRIMNGQSINRVLEF